MEDDVALHYTLVPTASAPGVCPISSASAPSPSRGAAHSVPLHTSALLGTRDKTTAWHNTECTCAQISSLSHT